MTSPSQLVAATRQAFETGKTKSISWRIQQLQRLYDMLAEEEETFVKALRADLNKPKQESLLMEIIICKNEAINAMKNIHDWAKPTYASKSLLQAVDTMYLQKEPLGVVLVLGAWNYPLQLTVLPVISAISAGNCVILKPSELAEETAKALTRLFPSYLDKECFPVYNGGIPETTALLKEKFDHIFYTGSSPVGKIIMAAAAKHLTPVTLELGGKSPVYVGKEVNANIVARRLLWGKLCNAGQTCIAPDYILCHEAVVDELISELKKVITEMLGEDPKASPDFCRIINDRHFSRITKVLEAMPKDKLVVGGEVDAASRYIAPTVYKDVALSDAVMEDEIFGPVLPIMAVGGVEEAIKIINAREKPLAVYIFSNNNKIVDRVLEATSSGGVCVNDSIMHCASHNMPFGGVGNSGFGRYHGKWGFDNLTHEKPVCWRRQNLEGLLSSRYMPYSDGKTSMIKRLTEEKQKGSCAVM